MRHYLKLELPQKTEKGIPTTNLGPAGAEVIKENQSPGSASAGAGCLTTWEPQASNPGAWPGEGGGVSLTFFTFLQA